ncbi:MAG: methyltransferase family protein [Hyphomicrobium sp.]
MPELSETICLVGALAAATLIPALMFGLKRPQMRVWPAPPVGSLRSFVFWTLFRTLNIATLGLAALRLFQAERIDALQLASLGLSAAAGVMYGRTLWVLGRKATYCQASGLETSGVYRWSRNPQYAAAIAAFACLAAGLTRVDVAALSAATIAVYALMARAEEPWLRHSYGAPYDAYAARVPRFFNFALLIETAVRKLRARQRMSTAGRKP